MSNVLDLLSLPDIRLSDTTRVVTLKWTIGDVVRKLRDDRGWSQATLADRATVARTSVLNLEKDSDTVDQRTVQRVADALTVPVSLLYAYRDFTNLFSELNEAQRAHILDQMREFASMNQPRTDRVTAKSATADEATIVESEAPTKARRAR